MESTKLTPKRETDVKTNISDLPEELIIKIFSFLSLSERKAARQVCASWCRLSYSYSLIRKDVTVIHKNFNLMSNHCSFSRHVNIRLKIDKEDDYLSFVLRQNERFWHKSMQTVRTLDLELPGHMVRGILERFIVCPLIERITLYIIPSNSPAYVPLDNSLPLPNLRSIKISGDFTWIAPILKVTLDNAPKVERIFLECVSSFGKIVPKQDMVNLVYRQAENLKEFYFVDNGLNDFLIAAFLKTLSDKLERLTLDINACETLHPFFDFIGGRFVNLKHIVLDNVYCDIGGCVKSIMALNSLTTVSLGGLMYLNDDMLKSLANLDSLKYFDMFCRSDITGKGFHELFGKKIRPEMVELRLRGLSHLSYLDVVREFAPNLPNLKVLFLSTVKITNRTLEMLMTNTPSLKCLTLEGNFENNPKPLVTNVMKNLKHLDICRTNIPTKIIGSLELPSLEFLIWKYKGYQQNKKSQLLKYELNNCAYLRFKEFRSGNKVRHFSCCKSPFVDCYVLKKEDIVFKKADQIRHARAR